MRRLRGRADRINKITRYDTNSIILKDSFNSFTIINNISI